jgi:LemA protein
MVPLMVLVGLIALLAIWLIGGYNGLIQLRQQVKNAWSQIDVQLKRRYDLIPNLVEVVKDYMSYEQETLQKVIQARNQAIAAQGPVQKGPAEENLTQAVRGLFALFENYPDLKANQNVGQLQEELTSTENKISFARQFYNDTVMRYNTRIQQFPMNLVAGMFGFAGEAFFESEAAAREPVRVDLR